MPELLSPAGNFEKLKAAIRYGADAVYLSGKRFGMRAAAGNFNNEELKAAVEYAHANHVRVYVTLNVMPRTSEYDDLLIYIRYLHEIGADAAIVSDIGVLALIRENVPDLEVHISTQASAVSAATCRAYHALGAKRVVLARELTLREIAEIRRDTPRSLELEAFVHGSMCIAYSGRCLLSQHFTGRDANRGMCTQPCRWNYRVRNAVYELVEEKRPDMPIPITEDGGETFIMSSKDMCMIEHIPELMESGLDSFKIEGRMKSAYYTAVVTNTYRMAMDAYSRSPQNYCFLPAYGRELSSVSHREYDTGFYFSDSHTDAKTTSDTGYLREKAFLAVILSYDEKNKRALCRQKNKMTEGENIELLVPGNIGMPLTVSSLTDTEGNPISDTRHPEMQFCMDMPYAANPGDILRGG